MWSSISGPFWMEDPSPLKHHSCAIPMRPPRSPHAAISTFNKAKSAEKGIAELIKQGVLPAESVGEISAFLMKNDGKLDLGKVSHNFHPDTSHLTGPAPLCCGSLTV